MFWLGWGVVECERGSRCVVAAKRTVTCLTAPHCRSAIPIPNSVLLLSATTPSQSQRHPKQRAAPCWGLHAVWCADPTS